MQILKCQACGSSDLVAEQGALVCSFCGRKYTREESERILSGPEAEALAFSYIAKSGEYRQQGQTSLEIQALLSALQVNGNMPDIWVRLGRAYRSLGAHEKALSCYEKALSLNPSDGVAYGNIGAVYLVRGQFQTACEYYEKGLSLISPNDVNYAATLGNYALAVGQGGDKKKAAKLLKEAERLGYQSADAVRKKLGLSFLNKFLPF